MLAGPSAGVPKERSPGVPRFPELCAVTARELFVLGPPCASLLPRHGVHLGLRPWIWRARVDADNEGMVQDVPEEVWARRMAKRAETIRVWKNTHLYRHYRAAAHRLPTPDPSDRNISKRAWEREVQYWKEDLRDWRRRCAQAQPS